MENQPGLTIPYTEEVYSLVISRLLGVAGRFHLLKFNCKNEYGPQGRKFVTSLQAFVHSQANRTELPKVTNKLINQNMHKTLLWMLSFCVLLFTAVTTGELLYLHVKLYLHLNLWQTF